MGPGLFAPIIPCGLYAGLPAHAIMYGLDRNMYLIREGMRMYLKIDMF